MPKKVKVSKNRKKNWRKHVNIDDVEDYLENKRFEERTGFYSTVTDDQLFMVDTEAQNDDNDDEKEKVPTTKIELLERRLIEPVTKESKIKKLSEGYRFFKKLENDSKVIPMRTQERKKITNRTMHNDDEKLVKYWIDNKDQIQESKKNKRLQKKLKTPIGIHEKDFAYDLWGVEELKDNLNEWIPHKTDLKVPVHHFQKKSLLPSVEVPPNALSYNPDPVAHKNALNAEAYNVLKMEQKEELYKPLYLSKKQAEENAKEYFNEMCQGLPGLDTTMDIESETVKDSDPEDDDNVVLKALPKKVNRKQKLRRKLEKINLRLKKFNKIKKLKEEKINQIRRYKRELIEEDKKSALKSLNNCQKKIAAMYKPAKLSRNRYVEQDIPITLPSEMTDSFRKMKVGGNILVERFKSFQKRNIIETRVPQFNKRKYKLKKEIKRRHKPEITDF